MSKDFTTFTNSHQRSVRYYLFLIVCLLVIILIVLLTCCIPKTPSGIILENNGFRATINSKVVPFNRYLSSDSGSPYGLIGPKPAQQYFENVYETEFSDLNHNWTNGQINMIKRYAMPSLGVGDPVRSYRLNEGGDSNLDFTHTLNYNATADLVFYVIGRDTITDGYLSLSMNFTSSSGEKRVHFVLIDTGAFPTSLPTDEHKINMNGFSLNELYTGFTINDLRSLIVSYDPTVEDIDFELDDIRFTLVSTTTARIYIDAISVQKYPYDAMSGLWYDEANSPVTDFYIEFTYEIYVDTDVIDINTFSLQAIYFYNESAMGIVNSMLASMIFDSLYFIWAAEVLDQFDVKSTGTIQSRNFPLPRTNFMGDTLSYEFIANLTAGGFGEDIDNILTPFSDSKSLYDSGFDFNWKKPINIV